MLQRIHRIRVLGIALTIAGSAGAQGAGDVAVDSKGANDEAREARKANPPRRSSEDTRRQNEPRERKAGEGSRSASAGVAAGRVNEAFSFLVGSGCQFSSTIRGTIRTAHNAPGDEPRYIPNLVVNSWVTCQNNMEQRVIDNTVRETPMTRSELEQAIELRGSLLDEGSGRRCAYVPDFALGEGKVAGFGVAYLCPVKLAADHHAEAEGNRAAPSGDAPRAPSGGKPSPDKSSSEQRGSPENKNVSDSRNSGENRAPAENKSPAERKGGSAPDDAYPDDYE